MLLLLVYLGMAAAQFLHDRARGSRRLLHLLLVLHLVPGGHAQRVAVARALRLSHAPPGRPEPRQAPRHLLLRRVRWKPAKVHAAPRHRVRGGR